MRKRPLSDVITDLLSEVTSLARSEVELAQAEVTENINRAVRNLVVAIAGGVVLIPAAVIFLEGISVLLMRAGVTDWLAYVIVAVVVAVIGVFVARAAAKKLSVQSLLPKKTIHQFKRDAEVASVVRPNHEHQRAA
jgi:hypothetical protein